MNIEEEPVRGDVNEIDAFPEEKSPPGQEASVTESAAAVAEPVLEPVTQSTQHSVFQIADADLFDRAKADDGPRAGVYIQAEPFRVIYREERKRYIYRAAVAALALLAAGGWGAYLYDRSPLYPAAGEQAATVAGGSRATRNVPLHARRLNTRESSAPVAFAAAVDPSRVLLTGHPAVGRVEPVETRPPAAGADLTADRAPAQVPRSRDFAPPALTQTDFSGPWILATGAEPRPGDQVGGLRPQYRVDLKQNGHRITGIAHRVDGAGETGQQGFLSSVPIDGTFDGKRLVMNFAGRTPADYARFVLHTEGDGLLRGRFSVAGASGVAGTSGMVEARRP